MNLKEQILNYQQDIINDLQILVGFPSILNKDSKYPYGDDNAKCLDACLKIFNNYGLNVTNVDYHAGFGEVGKGDKLIGILAHLDVVPVGDGWDSDPFSLTIKDNKAYGRGTSDDKGPLIAGLYAIRLLLDNNININKRIRLIVGCNEENGSSCLDYYVNQYGHIDYGFTPDASFPGIYGEKGNINVTIGVNNSNIISINGGVAANVVCDKVIFKLVKDSIDINKLKEYYNNNDIEYDIDENLYEFIVYGKPAHGSTPSLGINAISYALTGLAYCGYQDPLVDYYNKYINIYTDGSLYDLKCNDEYGDLTLNIGKIYNDNDKIAFTIDIRYPVTKDGQLLINKILDTKSNNIEILDFKCGKALFYKPDSPMIKALVSAYQKVSNDYQSKPCVIGGGTYSKGINNCIAFGGDFNDEHTKIHEANEFIKIDNLLKQIEIYYYALLNLLEL